MDEVPARERLTAWTNLADKVSFVHANALDMPFPDASFDVVWTQHASMNISDKVGLYREIARVLKPGGRIGITDIVAVDGLTAEQRAERGSYVGCIAGALSFAEFEKPAVSSRKSGAE